MCKNAVFACILAVILKVMKRNAPILGLVIGILLPMLGMAIFYFFAFRGTLPFGEYVSMIFSDGRRGSAILSLSALLNIIPFLFYTNRRLDLTARGLLIATMLYGVLFVLIKYVWN
jgi:hypothetical protein